MNEPTNEIVETRKDPLSSFGFWAFFVGLILSIIGATALMTHNFNPCFAFCLPLGYGFAATFTDKTWGDPTKFWPATPRLMLGCLLTAMVLFGLAEPLMK
jgi:hypothetical protein